MQLRKWMAATLLASVPLLPALAQDTASLLDDTRKTALPLLPQVVGTMQKAVKEGGVVGAIPVCKEKAPQMLQSLRERTGWQIQRVSLKVRNAKTGVPDTWEALQLADFNIRAQSGERPDQLEAYEIVTEGDGRRYFRYAKALPVVDVCTNCHGPLDTLSPELQAALKKDYPQDQATGYRVGQIRGALVVKRPL